MYILGLNAYHGDSAAAIIADGELIAAVEEERFLRVKHWAGFPRESIKYCLNKAGIKPEDLDYIALNRNTRANLHKKILFTLKNRPSLSHIKNRLSNMSEIAGIRKTFAEEFSVDAADIKAKIVNVEHHRAHHASSFFVSEFDEAASVSIDGFGDFTSVMVARGEDRRIEPFYQINYPHSLGIFYSAFTQFSGFPKYGDEYKVMGLAGFGKPVYLDKMKDVVLLKPNGRFVLNLKYFKHHLSGDNMRWHNTTPSFDQLYSDYLVDVFGKARPQDSQIDSHYKNIAASAQAMYEEALFHILNHAYKLTKCENLCLAGGCAMNSLANGRIFDNTPFKNIYIPPGAHDAGGAVGSAYFLYNQILTLPRKFSMETAYWGPEYSSEHIAGVLEQNDTNLNGFSVNKADNIDTLTAKTAKYIAEGKIVGWFQGKMEWGARALGNRSILADPRRVDMRDIINSKIKKRESFRPFAPSLLQEYVGEYFENDHPDPFMLKVYPVRKEKQDIIPAVTHVDGTGRLQTVNKKVAPLYWKLINCFYELTGVPVLLNTSFNENEPIVCGPQEALDCFLRTNMDILVLGDYMIERK